MTYLSFIFSLAAGFFVFELAYLIYFIKRGIALSKTTYTKSFKAGKKSKLIRVLVAGDSIGAGVGASSFEASAAGRIAGHLSQKYSVALKNCSANGCRMQNLAGTAPNGPFDLAVIFISSNDVLKFTNLKNFEDDAKKVFRQYSGMAKKVTVIGPANIGEAKVFPLLLRFAYLNRAQKYAAVLERTAGRFKNVAYVNSLMPPKRLGKYTGKYYSSDMFHPNDEGHRFWFEMVKEHL